MKKSRTKTNRTTKRIPLVGAALAGLAASVPADDAGRIAVPPLADTLAYTLPSPPSAVYEVANTMSVGINTPGGSMQITGELSMTLDMAFADDGTGLLVTGSVSSFEASVNNAMMGVQSGGMEVVSGTIEFVLNRRGETEVSSMPAVSGPLAQFSPFEAMGHSFFPRLPDAEVEPGGMWTDTVTWSTADPTTDGSSTAVFHYTLAGDTVVDGRTLAKIDVAGEVASEADIDQGGMSITQSMSGSVNGFILWDMERGIMAGSESEQTLEGTTSVPGMPSMSMSATGTETVRLTG